MKVESFEVQEVESCVGEMAAEAKSLAEQLGLKGQEQFYSEHRREACPYRKMTAQEKVVYDTLLPVKTDLEKYADMPIPLRVLQIAAHARSCFPHASLMVWHPSNADDKDPLLVATQNHPDRSYETQHFILARWGEELEEFGVLRDRAKNQITVESRAALLRIKQEVEGCLSAVEASVESNMLKGEKQAYSFYQM